MGLSSVRRSPRVRLALVALAVLAVTALGAASCDLVLDIGSLDRGRPDGGPLDGGNLDGGNLDSGNLDGGNDVEVIATGQCYPGDITLADGFLYWGTTSGLDGCSSADAILRLAIPEAGIDGSPTTVVSHDLGGVDAGGRPWTIVVADAGVYWLGCGTLCTAAAGQELQGCSLAPIKPPACASGVALAGPSLVYANGCSGNCGNPGEGRGAFESLDTIDGSVSALGLQVVGDGGLGAVSASADGGLWIAWIDGANCARLGSPGASVWSSCDLMPTSQAFPGAVVNDGEQVYWMELVVADNTYNLLVHLPFNNGPTTLVTDIGMPLSMALDGTYVYFTAEDQGGSVYAVPRAPTHPTSAAQLTPLATHRAHPGHSGPYRITAADPTWLYWVNVAPDGTIERILKP